MPLPPWLPLGSEAHQSDARTIRFPIERSLDNLQGNANLLPGNYAPTKLIDNHG
jgi:hypothetical protein